LGLSALNRAIDDFVINLGFDEGCRGVGLGGKLMSRLQSGRVQNYLRVIGVALAVLVLFLIWGCHSWVASPLFQFSLFCPCLAQLFSLAFVPSKRNWHGGSHSDSAYFRWG